MTAPKDALVADKLDRLAEVIRKHGTCAPMALNELATELRDASAPEQAVEPRTGVRFASIGRAVCAVIAEPTVWRDRLASEFYTRVGEVAAELDHTTHRPADAADSKGVGDARVGGELIGYTNEAAIRLRNGQPPAMWADGKPDDILVYASTTPQHGGDSVEGSGWLKQITESPSHIECTVGNLRDLAAGCLQSDPSVGIFRDEEQHDLITRIADALELGELYVVTAKGEAALAADQETR